MGLGEGIHSTDYCFQSCWPCSFLWISHLLKPRSDKTCQHWILVTDSPQLVQDNRSTNWIVTRFFSYFFNMFFRCWNTGCSANPPGWFLSNPKKEGRWLTVPGVYIYIYVCMHIILYVYIYILFIVLYTYIYSIYIYIYIIIQQHDLYNPNISKPWASARCCKRWGCDWVAAWPPRAWWASPQPCGAQRGGPRACMLWIWVYDGNIMVI